MIQLLCNQHQRFAVWVDKRCVRNISTSHMGSRRHLSKSSFGTTCLRAFLLSFNVLWDRMAWEQLETQPTAGKWTLLTLQNCTSQHLTPEQILASANLSLLCRVNSLIYAFIQLPRALRLQSLVHKYLLSERCWLEDFKRWRSLSTG